MVLVPCWIWMFSFAKSPIVASSLIGSPSTPNAIIIEAWDRELEQGIVALIGSTGKGVGAATAWSDFELRRPTGSLGSATCLQVRRAADMPEPRPVPLRPSGEVLDEAYRAGQKILLLQRNPGDSAKPPARTVSPCHLKGHDIVGLPRRSRHRPADGCGRLSASSVPTRSRQDGTDGTSEPSVRPDHFWRDRRPFGSRSR